MTTVDINTSAFVGHRISTTPFLIPILKRLQAIARQLRLRNLGGIIVSILST
ncbi:ribonuclease E/G [Salmonella enterica subsp. enterica]|nr:ribonuclease E/G [Salmonella enterica subsp. enterica]